MISFLKERDQLVMRYVPDSGREDWLVHPLEKDEEIPFSSRTFSISKRIYRSDFEDQDHAMDACYHFIVGNLENGYYRMDRTFLGIDYDLFMHRSLNFKRSTFVAERNIPIFRGLNVHKLPELWIGGDRTDSLPEETFNELLAKFPNTGELDRYARARVSGIIRNYLPAATDFEELYRKYMKRKASRKGSQPRDTLAPYEAEKYSALVAKIETMLSEEVSYTENQWQDEIIQIIQFLYPKYIKAIKEAPVRDSLAGKDRKIDFLMVDASGYVDAIEIKKPFADCIVTSNRYRDNHVPMRELNGTVMQLEKYLYHLSRWGQKGEETLNKRYVSVLPKDLQIKIVNPCGMIIMGRDLGLTPEQRTDFEVIRRKYRNVLEIMTYDDLLRRLKTIRDQLRSENPLP